MADPITPINTPSKTYTDTDAIRAVLRDTGSEDYALNVQMDAGSAEIGSVSIIPPTTITSGDKDVASAGTPEALATTTAVEAVVIKAKSANTGTISVGSATSQDITLSADDSITIPVADLATVYIDASVSSEGVNYLAVG